jgi:putative ABC transport system permease protein
MTYNRHKLRFALLMSWRETRAAAGKFAFLVVAIALGTGALTAVTGFNASVRRTLSREARSLMAADMSVRLPLRAPKADLDTLKALETEGIVTTRVTETVSMATSGKHVPVLISVKGADLSRYPFYGDLGLDPPHTKLDENSVAVSDDLLLRLGIQPGDSIRVGKSELRVAARVVSEPDRMTTGFTLGPRVLFTREGLEGTGIITDISRVTERVLLKLPENHDLAALRTRLETAYGKRASITDYTETNPALTRALDRSTRFLSMVSLIALIVGGLGVGATMQSHLRQKMTNIAFMKCIGGRSEHILYIYLAQAVWLGILGSVLGAILGAFAQSVFARLVASYFDVHVTLIWPVAAMLQGIVAGLTTTALFSLPPLLAIRKIRPATLLQKAFAGESSTAKDRASRVAAVVTIAGLWGIAVWVSGSVLYATVFAGSLIAGICILALIGAVLLRVMKRVSNVAAVRNSRSLRHGIGNLYRPGAHSVAILTSLAIGVMFVMSVYFIQHSLLEEIRITAPPDAPNVFMINITNREKDGIAKILESDPAITNRQPLSPAVSATLTSVDGTPVEQLSQGVATRRFTNTVFVLTWSEAVPAATEILQGKWWDPKLSEPLVSVNEVAAENLGIHLDSILVWNASGGSIRARVANIRRTDGARTGVNSQFVLSPGVLDGFTTAYFGAVRVKPGGIGPLQKRIFESYPTVTVVNAADILDIVQGVMDKTSQAISFVAGFAIAGGLIVLASSVAGTRYRRMREVAIFRTVGATKAALVRIFTVEFMVIGLAAGLLGSVLATIFSSILVARLLEASYHFRWFPALVATAVTALLTSLAGWMASYGVLRKKPLEILREIE